MKKRPTKSIFKEYPQYLTCGAIAIMIIFSLAGCSGGGGGDGISDGFLGSNIDWGDWQVVSESFTAVATEDINGDGAIDILFTEQRGRTRASCENPPEINCMFQSELQHFARLYMQDTLNPGTFLAAENYPLTTYAYAVAAGDLDQDGIPDFAVPQLNTGRVRIFSRYLSGSGGFLSQVDYEAGTKPVCLAVGDLNGDNLPDLAVGGDNLVLLMNRAASHGRSFSLRSLGIQDISSIAVADIDNDSRNDLVATSEDSIIVLLQDSAPAPPGNFTASGTYAAGTSTRLCVSFDCPT